MLEGTCHCGVVRISIPRQPRTVTSCNCSICRRYGALWAYYQASTVRIRAARRVVVLFLGRCEPSLRSLQKVRMHHALGGSVSEVIRASLRLLEECEQGIRGLSRALIEGEASGDAGPLEMKNVKRKARRAARARS